MDLDVSSPPVVQRGAGGVREVEEWGLKVQKLASVHSVTLFFVSAINSPVRMQRPADAQSESITGNRSSVWYVGFKGDPKNNTMDMSKLGTIAAHDTADKKVDEVAEKKGSGYTTIR